jgi:hypothetical protein
MLRDLRSQDPAREGRGVLRRAGRSRCPARSPQPGWDGQGALAVIVRLFNRCRQETWRVRMRGLFKAGGRVPGRRKRLLKSGPRTVIMKGHSRAIARRLFRGRASIDCC